MDFTVSNRRKNLLRFQEADPEFLLNISEIRRLLADTFERHRECVLALTHSAPKVLKFGTLVLHLVNIARRDTVVRQLVTCGHLAKVISRFDYISSMSAIEHYSMISCENKLFDAKSMEEFIAYFGCLPPTIPPEKELDNVSIIKARERSILFHYRI